MGQVQVQVLTGLEPGANAAAAAITCGLVADEPSGVFLLDLVAALDHETIHAVYQQKDP